MHIAILRNEFSGQPITMKIVEMVSILNQSTPNAYSAHLRANFEHEDYSFPLACDRIVNIALRLNCGLRNFTKLRDKILNYTSLRQCPFNHRQQQTVGLIGPRG
jgi:hypothetical protein